MNRWRQRNVGTPSGKLRAQDAGQSPIDLGFSLSIYGKNADGTLVELSGGEPGDRDLDKLRGIEPWPTEQ